MSKTAYAVSEKRSIDESNGEYVMEDLVDLDEIAYIRFASVYRQFKDMSVFLKELQDIVDKAKE